MASARASTSTAPIDDIVEDATQGDEPIVEPLEVSEDGELVYLPLTSKYVTSVTDCLHGSYYMEEDLCRILQVSKNAEPKYELNDVVRECIKDGVSFICLKKVADPERPDYVIGVAINRIEIPDDPFWHKMKNKCKDSLARSYCVHRFNVNRMDRRRHSVDKLEIEEIRKAYIDDPSLFDKHNTEYSFNNVLVCVHLDHRRAGIGTKLMKHSLKCAQDLTNGINSRYEIYGRPQPLVRPGIVKATAIGPIGQNFAEKLGLIKVIQTDYMFKWYLEGPKDSSCALYYMPLERQLKSEGKKLRDDDAVVEVHHSKDSPIEPPSSRIPEEPEEEEEEKEEEHKGAVSFKKVHMPYIDDSSTEDSPSKPGPSSAT